MLVGNSTEFGKTTVFPLLICLIIVLVYDADIIPRLRTFVKLCSKKTYSFSP